MPDNQHSKMIDHDEENQINTAVTRAHDGYEWRGKTLPFAWSFLRKTAARRLGLQFGFVSEEDMIPVKTIVDGKEQIVRAYDMSRDIAIAIWLCHQDVATCKAARRKPEKFEDEIDEWADANEISSEDARDLSAFLTMMHDDYATQAEPRIRDTAKADGGTPDPNELTPPNPS